MIAVLGSANMDVVTEVDRIPLPGETVVGKRLRRYPGGKGANQAVAAARVGGTVSFFGKVGDDPFGRELLDSLRRNGVDVSAVDQVADAPTGTASIWVDRAGENAIASVPGANGMVDNGYVDRVFDRLIRARVLMLQFEIPLPTINYLLNRLPADRPTVIVDPAPALDMTGLRLDRIDILTPNRSELAALAGTDELEAAARSLLDRGVRHVLCKAGEEGAYWFHRGFVHVPSLTIAAIDSTAAGDAFNAALACRICDLPMVEAIRWANAAGALTAMGRGAQPSLPTRQDVERALAQHTA